MNIRANILLRTYLAFGLVVLFAIVVFAKLIMVQFVEGKKWKTMASRLSTKEFDIETIRGNIYSHDGSLLATSIPEYELRMDMYAGGIEDDDVFNEKVDSLGMKLAVFFKDKTVSEYIHYLRSARRDSVRYLLIQKNVSYQQLKQVRKFPLFNIGKFSGGLIVIQQNKRLLPFKDLAERTIGYKNKNVKNGVGLEGSFGEYLNGVNGKQLKQRISGGVWIPIGDDTEVAPKEGADIISTIDVNMQGLAQSALKKQLIKSQADHGVVILMEVATGEIRAIANYSLTAEGKYKEIFNYAIAGNQDPGSTFKLASYMALLEDDLVDTSTLVGTGKYEIPGHTITDSHGSIGVVTVKKAFEESSNSAVAKLVDEHYRDNQSKFTDHLYEWHLNEKIGLQISGEATPVVKNPKNASWNKRMTLPQMAYGYEMQLTPLKMLSFYNAVANNGTYIAPIFVTEIRRLGNPIAKFKARVVNEKICNDKTLRKVKSMLEGVVTEGSGRQMVYNPQYKIAGKTGTAQVADANKGYAAKRQYQASFVGYFPADKPKYSMIVVINDPKGDYYGAVVCGPVFKEIADRIYARDLDIEHQQVAVRNKSNNPPKIEGGRIKSVRKVYSALGVKTRLPAIENYFTVADSGGRVVFKNDNLVKGKMPNLVGMGLRDALFLVGNSGLKTKVSGYGKVFRQSLSSGSRITRGETVELQLR